MKTVFLILFMMMAVGSFAQTDFDRSIDKENGSVIYKGQFTFDDLKKEATFGWLEHGAASYKPDSATVVFLKRTLSEYNIVVLLGTWCEDSQNLLPKFYKTLQASAYPLETLSMYGVNRAKEAKYIEHKLYRLDKVPTIILFKDHTEIGRIVETVKLSIEKDIARIIEHHLEQPE